MKILIICPIQEEFDAVKALLNRTTRSKGKATSKSYLSGTYGKHKVMLLKSGRGSDNVSNTVHAAMNDFQFTHILLVGTAGGITKVKQGDIVIGTAGYQYEWGREMDEEFLTIPKNLAAKPALLELSEMTKARIIQAVPALKDANVKVHFKPIASGSKVIESTSGQVFQILRQRFNDAVALEMEAYAFQAAVNNYKEVEALNIRSIADMLSNKQAANAKGSKQLAARHAALFALELIQQLEQPAIAWRRLAIPVAATLAAILIIWTNFFNTQSQIPSTPIPITVNEQQSSENLPTDTAKVIVEKEQPKQPPKSNSSTNPTTSKPLLASAKQIAIKDTSEVIAVTDSSTILPQVESQEDEFVHKGDAKKTNIDPLTLAEDKVFIDRCYILVKDKHGKKVRSVAVFIDGKRMPNANNYMSLPAEELNLFMEKGDLYYEDVITVRANSKVAPTFSFKLEWFEEKDQRLIQPAIKKTRK